MDHRAGAPAGVDGGASNRLLMAEEVAERWQVPASHVYRLAREERLPVVKLGRYRRFRPADVEAFEAAGGVDA
ncbi:helix-turn-helix domain-containing protein [Candidatus Solirubrobacter pratensis]|uniref:helix-turn-helix domain-containing protein n=1 Tax=Candidatus Solirubrobacter pratensis TaxID=1298857 RepID=UPI000406BE00|nr:helix-turn-helix domain-containing protein [Candidatus Solirubrobacter pratensis]